MDPGRINESDVSRVETLIDILLLAIPQMAADILSHSSIDPGSSSSKQILAAPTSGASQKEEEEDGDERFGDTFGIEDKGSLLDKQQKENLLNQFDKLLSSKIENNTVNEMWDEWKWFVSEYLSNFIQIICRSQALESPRVSKTIL